MKSQYLADLSSDDLASRIEAVKWLGINRVEEATEQLIGLMKHPDDELRREVIYALRRIRNEQASIPMIACLNDPDDAIRRSSSTWFMTLTGDQSHLTEPLCKVMLADESRMSTRDFAAMLLGKFGDERAVPYLHQVIRQYPRIRLRATLSLMRMADPRSVPVLRGLLEDEDIRVQQTAAKVLQEIGTSEALEAVQQWKRGHR